MMWPDHRPAHVRVRRSDAPRVVALGGGHGLAASLRALRLVTDQLVAVVTVADDGGSSGRLREELDVIPPGDLRQALSALCDDSDWGTLWRDVLQHRFGGDGPMEGHATGNLLIVTLWELLDDPVAGLDTVGQLLGARGRVLPMCLRPLSIEADVVKDGVQAVVSGQHKVAAAAGSVTDVRLVPQDAPATPEALEALKEADWVVLGPGSFYTSVMPHLLHPIMRRAVVDSPGKKCLLMNLVSDTTETAGMTPGDHLRELHRLVPDLRLDVVVADPYSVDDLDDVRTCAEKLGAEMVFRQLAAASDNAVHDPLRLGAALQDIVDRALGDTPRV